MEDNKELIEEENNRDTIVYSKDDADITDEATEDASQMSGSIVDVETDDPDMVTKADEATAASVAEQEKEAEERASEETKAMAELAEMIGGDLEAVGGDDADGDEAADTDSDTKEEEGSGKEKVKLSPEDMEIAEKIRQRKIEAARKNRRLKVRLTLAAVLSVTAIVFLILSFTPIFTVDSIEVSGNSHYTAEEIISMGHAVPGKNLIYHADKSTIEGYLEQNPYIKSASVKRKLPSTLVIEVSERTEMMALAYDGDYLILDREGILLRKNRSLPKLTLIEGNVINRIKQGEELGTKDAELLNKSIKLVQMMEKSDLYYVRVDMSDTDNVRAYIYDTLYVKNDYDTLMENMKNGKLHLVLDKLFADNIKRGTITFGDDGTASFMPTI